MWPRYRSHDFFMDNLQNNLKKSKIFVKNHLKSINHCVKLLNVGLMEGNFSKCCCQIV